MYTVGINYERSVEEYNDPFLAWKRSDKAFFASGACHILAYMFLSVHDKEGYKLIHIKPRSPFRGNHMYASNGTWAFDFNGWALEKELLTEYEKAYQAKYPGWSYDRIEVDEPFHTYIQKSNHMPPEYFPYLPWERAYKYIKSLPPNPPS